jgi:hypothetical protein
MICPLNSTVMLTPSQFPMFDISYALKTINPAENYKKNIKH